MTNGVLLMRGSLVGPVRASIGAHVPIEGGIQRGTDQDRDGQDIQPQEYGDGGRQRTVDRRATGRIAQRPPNEVAAEDPQGQGEGGTREPDTPSPAYGQRQVVERGQEADRQ